MGEGEGEGELICTVMLSGDLEVPPVTTDASGVASFYWFAEEDLVHMVLHHDVVDVTVAHFHTGAPGENGPPVITLDTSTNPIVHDLTVAEYNALMNDPHYINVHSTVHPPGEIRGDLDCTPINIGGEGEGEGEGEEPDLNIYSNLAPDQIFINDRLELQAGDGGTGYVWLKDGMYLEASERITGVDQQILVIDPVQAEDVGTYTCEFHFNGEPVTSESFMVLQIHGAQQVPLTSILSVLVLLLALLYFGTKKMQILK